jgi:hypothetical protein
MGSRTTTAWLESEIKVKDKTIYEQKKNCDVTLHINCNTN